MILRLALAALLLACAQTRATDQPNIILFLVDDLGWQDTSVPMHTERTPFSDRYRTPNFERLASGGVVFTNAYASAPVCTPSRTSIMTGRSPGQTHISYWTLHKDRDTSRNHPTLAAPAWRMNGLDDTDVTLPALLRDAGYRTIHVGKAHFGAHDTPGADPTNLGFDINIAGHASGGPASYYGVHHFSQAGKQGKPPGSAPSVWDIPGLEKYHGRDIYLTDALALETRAAIEDAARDNTPFYLNFAPYAVHAPIMPSHQRLARYADLPPREAAYASMIETVDAALGTILDTLETLGIEDNTLVILTSDNGGLSAHARAGPPHIHNAPLRSGKGSAYEGGTRVPFIARWPGRAEPGSRRNTPIISHDLFPTILAAAGIAIPSGHAATVEGIDLGPYLRPGSPRPPTRPLFWHQPHQWGAAGPGIEPFTSVREGNRKLVYFHAGPRFELYDLSADIGESDDLAEQGHIRRLAGLMDEWISEYNVQLSIDKATGAPIPMPGAAAATIP